MHELGVAFVQRDSHGRGFLWSINKLMPSQAGRAHSETLLLRFRVLCEELANKEIIAAELFTWPSSANSHSGRADSVAV